MTDAELFQNLSPHEQAYAQEALERWDPTMVRESHRRYGRLSAAEKQALKDRDQVLRREWAALIGTDPAGPHARALVDPRLADFVRACVYACYPDAARAELSSEALSFLRH